mmetsp:Transcript_25480/g.65840  ORF Transcript_25480/g.65840 Transcript_25480/m.65840 type:complete len:349 (-) Transcript_25480:322-1368(-)|eukprot:CAMPEP_0119406884 /NCGR_PEP_ID=MMETSP1335-20130426/1036_1 /TAXON_ID=259385 /ORGANISM="Chrysoculter rhomboideus, Strain RCC1486" /LENGTH=348 /DNA_ID=CAMNT_0007430977 /DNA_START=70 /DNA_END=1116 /DNA_ORIENTATION=+
MSTADCSPRTVTTLQKAANTAFPAGAVSATASALSVPAFLHGNAFAATLASGFVTSISMYPVDVLRAVRMSQAASSTGGGGLISAVISFRRAHGWGGFIKQGAAQEVARSTTMQALKFFLFPVFHQAMFDMDERQGSAATRAAAGATCAIVEGVVIGPIEVAKVGLQLDAANKFNNSGAAVLRACMRARGPLGAYAGYTGVQWRQSSWTGAFFGSLRFWERRADDGFRAVGLDRTTTPSLVGPHKVLSGFTAGAFASLFNCPADVVRTNVQKQFVAAAAEGGSRAQLKLGEFVRQDVAAHWAVARSIVASKGISGLYVGYGTKAGHLGGCGALMAVLVPRFKEMLGCE